MIEVMATGVVILAVIAVAVVAGKAIVTEARALWRAARPTPQHPPWVPNPETDWSVPRELDEDEDKPPRVEPEAWEVPHDTAAQHRDGQVNGWQIARHEHRTHECVNVAFCICSCKRCQTGDHPDRVPGS